MDLRAISHRNSMNGSQLLEDDHGTFKDRHASKADRDIEKASDTAGAIGSTASKHHLTSKDRYVQSYSTKIVFNRLGRTNVDLVTRQGKETGIPNHTWLHIRNESVSFEQFLQKCENMTVDPEYKPLVRELLSDVRKTNEKSFVSGRYLRPNAVVIQTKRGDRRSSRFQKRVSFFAMPFFALRPLRRENADKHSLGFPVRPLLQSIYSLESTTERDLNQINSKMMRSEGIVHVPEVWAMIIGKRLLVTRSSTDLELLQGTTIRQTPFYKTPGNSSDADLSVVHLTDKASNMYYIPINECQTFYEFVSHVANHCLRSPTADIGDLDFRNEPRGTIDEHSWTKLLLKHKNLPVLRITLGNHPKARRKGLDHWQDSDSSDSSTNTSVPSRRGGSSYMSYRDRGDHDLEFLSTVGEELKDAYQALENAELVKDLEIIYALKFGKIPEIEDRFMLMLEGTFATKLEQKDAEQAQSLGLSSHEIMSGAALIQTGRKITQQMPNSFKSPLLDSQMRRYGRLSEIASVVKLPSPPESSSSESEGSDRSDKMYRREEIWFKKPRRVWRGTRRREPAIQYIPSKAALQSTLDGINARKRATTYAEISADQKISRLEKNTETIEAEDSTALRERLSEIINGTQSYIPLFQWSLGFNLGPDFSGAEYIQDKTGDELHTVNVKSTVFVDILLHDIDRECNPANCSSTSGLGIKICYKRAETRSVSEVEDLLDTLQKTVADPDKRSWREARHNVALNTLFECQLALYKVAKVLIGLFIPETIQKSVVLGKYWGSVYRIIANLRHTREILQILPHLVKLASTLRTLHEGALDSRRCIPAAYVLPQAIPVAFKSLVYFLISFSLTMIRAQESTLPEGLQSVPKWEPSLSAYSQMYINYKTTKIAIKESKQQIVSLLARSKTGVRPSQFDMASGEDLATLMLSELQNHLVTSQGDFLLSEIYMGYADKMQYHVTRSASVQTYDEINRFREEISAIRATLHQQQDMLRDLSRNLFKSRQTLEYGVDRETIRHHTVDKLRDQVNERLDAFEELSKQADRIQMMAAQSISLKSEANNRAIVIFTIVTIVFLPLSFVTSFFGMNTADIRDINNKQWIFWASAMPLTVIVVLAALMTGYWERLQRWAGLVKREKID